MKNIGIYLFKHQLFSTSWSFHFFVVEFIISQSVNSAVIVILFSLLCTTHINVVIIQQCINL